MHDRVHLVDGFCRALADPAQTATLPWCAAEAYLSCSRPFLDTPVALRLLSHVVDPSSRNGQARKGPKHSLFRAGISTPLLARRSRVLTYGTIFI